jgi:hypothetical protein
MVATLSVCQEETRPAAEPDFLEMLPTIRRAASYAFRRVRRAVREDLVAEAVGNAYAAFRRLVERGKAALAYASVLAKFAIKQVREGRRIGTKRNVLDVMSSYAQRRKGFLVIPLPKGTERSEWQEIVVEDRHASPAEVAACRIDFRSWLGQLERFKRSVALALASGASTGDAARKFKLSVGRVSQLRRELADSWNAFQAMPAAV